MAMQYHYDYSSVREDLEASKDSLRVDLLKYSRKAFNLLPQLENPSILDIGCGSGVPTIELARLSKGTVTAIDIDGYQLSRLRKKIEEAGLTANIHIDKCSMSGLKYAEESFDIIWAEGSIAVIGFEKGIKEWRHLLKKDGFLVLHDDLGNINDKLKKCTDCGYSIVSHFILNENIWWNEYYARLKKELNAIREAYPGDKEVEEILGNDQNQIDGYYKQPADYRSFFVILRKINL